MPNQLLLRGQNDLAAAVQRVQMLYALQNGSGVGFMDGMMFDDLGPTLQQTNLFPSSNIAVRVYYAQAGNALYFFLNGISTAQQGQDIWDAYAGPTFGSASPYYNGWYARAAVNIVSRVINLQLPITSVNCIGHSAGAAVGWYILAEYKNLFPLATRRICCFGSPKAMQRQGGFDAYNMISQFDSCHWMNADDPVPFVPPRPINFARVMAGLSVWQGARLGAYDYPPNGINITLLNSTVPGDSPQGNQAPALSSIGTWLEQQTAGLTNAHSLVVYKSRLEQLLAALPPAAQVRPVQVVNPANPALPPLRLHQIQAQNIQALFTDATRQNSQPVVIPVDQAFRAAKKGGVWVVLFGDVEVAIAPRRRRARSLANAGNDFLRKLQNEAVVNAGDLASQWVAYLEAASTPGSGFRPQLNTSP